MSDFIPVNVPLLNGNERKYLNECIDTGWISSEGPFVSEFENKMAAYVGREHGIAVSSGSAALDIAVAALGIGEGDEVILPAHTIISCAAAIVRAGATPVLVDSDPITWNMDVKHIEERITPRTKAIMIVHLYGLPVDFEEVIKIAEAHKIAIIEDAAQMIGQTYKGRQCGSFGDISTFSFYPNKHVTTGEGGMCLTNNSQLAERCRSFRNLCFQKEKRFVHEELGWNYRITNLQAALGLAQLENIEEHIQQKRKIGKRYHDLLSDIKQLQLPMPQTGYADNIYWVFGLVLDSAMAQNSTPVIKKLGLAGIGCRPFFWPMNLQPVFQKMGLFSGETYPVAEKLGDRGFYIPSGMALTDDEANLTAEKLRQVIEG